MGVGMVRESRGSPVGNDVDVKEPILILTPSLGFSVW